MKIDKKHPLWDLIVRKMGDSASKIETLDLNLVGRRTYFEQYIPISVKITTRNGFIYEFQKFINQEQLNKLGMHKSDFSQQKMYKIHGLTGSFA